MATVIIFLIILGVLVFVHELGHFLLAKKAGVKVEEFGFGYPPRALKIGEKWGTLFSLNWIPFGGFVKIAGENYDEEETTSTQSTLSQKTFIQVSKKWQAAILAAGVTFNVLFAWLLFSLGFMIGLPVSVDNSYGAAVKNPALTITEVTPNSPAQKAGLKSGDRIQEISLPDGKILQNPQPSNISDFVNNSSGDVLINVERGNNNLDFDIKPKTDPSTNKRMIGIGTDMVGTLSLPFYKAFYEGGRSTLNIAKLTVVGVWNLIKGSVVGKADLTQVTGPVGIIGLVGDASRLGFSYLITFAALISINLAIINLVPFPALDGGRILFVIIEGISRRKINPKVANILNTVGFALIILLMLFVTYRDIVRLF
jgi:regulator of sigma E protease